MKLPFPNARIGCGQRQCVHQRTLLKYSKVHTLLLTRSRAYKNNDQAWIEQKNGAVVRKLVGYDRLEGETATAALGKLHQVARLYVNLFQPSFKLESKTREGAKVKKKYFDPATPYERLLANSRVTEKCKEQAQQPRNFSRDSKHRCRSPSSPHNCARFSVA